VSAGEAPRRSSVAFDPPDTCVWTLVGDVDVDLMRELADAQERGLKGLPHVFSLLDVTDIGSVSAEARKEAARKRDVNMRGTAFIGASFHIRVLATLLSKAAKVLNRDEVAPMRFFKTKAEALAWFEELRAEIARAAGP
jgi:hypothetical protein